MPHHHDALSFWDRESVAQQHSAWMAAPAIRRYLNTLIGGSEHDWPFNWFVRFLGGRRFSRVLSIGCGTGALERDILRRGLAERVDAFDGSITSLAIAREEAQREGFGDAVRYFAADFNEPFLPAAIYDAVFFHHSLHHVAKLEKLLRAVMLALKPDGLLYLDEYVGPSRDWWTDAAFVRQRALFTELVPPDARWVDVLPLPVVEADPSEGIRSGEILDQVRVGFDIVEARPYGGNLLSVFCPAMRWDHVSDLLVERLIEAEREFLANGEPHYLSILVARPKRGIAKQIASAKYFAAPKVKRLLRQLRRRRNHREDAAA